MTAWAGRPPRRVIVVGGGIVGLSCAWSLQQRGVAVQVLDRQHEGAGASWGNAGYVAPALTVPLPQPSVLRFALRAMARPGSPVFIPLRADRDLLRFLTGTLPYCTKGGWRRSMAVYRPLNEAIFAAFDDQRGDGTGPKTEPTDILACFREPRQAAGLLHELHGVASAGQRVDVEMLSGSAARELEPALSPGVTFAVRIRDQRFIIPSTYVEELAEELRRGGGEIIAEHEVTAVQRHGDRVLVRSPAGDLEADAAVIANGARLGGLARPHGVTLPIHAGRGYSFVVPSARPLRGPVYLSAARVAIAPHHGSHARITGLMDLVEPDSPLNRLRIESIIEAAAPLLDGLDWQARKSDWAGSRPLTSDGRPLIGASKTPGIYIAGGHGMWGVTLGPLTGRLLAEQITTGIAPTVLKGLGPCR